MSATSYHHLKKAPAPGAPMIFAFHGTGGDEHQFFGMIEQMRPEAGIVSPRGDVSEHGANRFFRRTGEGIYDMDDLAARTRAMARFIRAHRDQHAEAPVYAIGYSNGANILASVLMLEPELVTRAALMHPLIPWEPEDVPGLETLRVLITAGRRDPICPLPLTERLIAWFERQGSTVETAMHEGGHEVRPEELAALQGFVAG